MRLNEFIPKSGEVQGLYCSRCGDPTVLTFQTFDETFQRFDEDSDGIRVTVEGLPTLRCEDCGLNYLPDRSRREVFQCFLRATKTEERAVHFQFPKLEGDFGFTKVPFIYDPRDYYYIPGLFRRHNIGFLTPVFFDKTALIYFHHHPKYIVDFASKTYGEIRKGREHGLSFGINKNGKLIMWLGDIAELPVKVQYRLRADNVKSDHDIGSEFYDGQIECKFTEPTSEDRLIKARSEFHHAALQLFGRTLSQLDDEVLELLTELKSPITFNETENKHIIDVMNKVNIEALHAKNLEHLLRERGVSSDRLGSLKRLEKLYEFEFPKAPIHRTLSALHSLYGLRIAFLHLRSGESRLEEIRSAASLIGIKRKRIRFEIIYPILLEKITMCYEKLYKLTVSHLD